MTEAQVLQCAPVPAGHAQASTPGHRGGRGRRLGTRLWSLLHAPALLTGGVSGPGGGTPIENDRGRPAGRPAGGPTGAKTGPGQRVLGLLGWRGSGAVGG